MAKIGFVNICHNDYLNDTVYGIINTAVERIRNSGIEVFQIEKPVTDSFYAERAGRELLKEEVEGVIVFLGTWIECPVAMSVIREIEHLPICLWGFPMIDVNNCLKSTGSYVSYAMFKGTLDRVKYRYKPVLGSPADSDTIKKIVSFCKAASASEKLKRTRIGLVGYTSMGIYPGTFDHVLMRVLVGPEIEQYDSYTIVNMADSFNDKDCGEIINYIRNSARIRDDVSQEDLIKASKLFLALRKLTSENRLHSINVKCQYEFSKEYKMVTCVPLSLLSEFGVVASCEGDILNTVSMVILNYLSGNIVTYGDVMNHMENVIKLSSCGFVPYCFGNADEREIRKFMPHPAFNRIQNSIVLRPGKVTIMRLVEDQCGYHFIHMTGDGLETELRDGYMPALDIRLDGDINNFIDNFSGQHYAICYGDLTAEIKDLAGILGFGTVKI